MFSTDLVYKLLRRNAELIGFQHDRRAVSIVGAYVDTLMSALLLKTHPDIGLNIFNEVPKVNGAVGIGKCARHENLALGFGHGCQIWNSS